MIPSDSPGPKKGVGENSVHVFLWGLSYTASKSSLAVMHNFATFEWLLWQQWSLGGTLK